MAGFGEPWEWTTDRNQRMESEYPELADTSADDVLGTDNYAVSQGRAPTQFSSTAMGLGAHSVVSKETEDNSWWGAIKRAGSSILALDTPISERLGYKVPEGSGPADELANFALEEATRPSNIAFSAIGALLSASGVGAPVGAPILAGTAARITAGATTRAAARGAAKNIAIGIGGRVAATGVEKVAEYAPEEIGPLAGLASAGAGLYATRGRSGLTRGAAALAAGGIGYASPELAGGIAGGVLTSKAIGGFSSWKEAANSIDSRAATQAETQAAQLLEQAEVSKQRMRDLAAAERRGETRIASDRMPEIPMGQEWEQNGLGQVAYKTGGDDASRRAALRTTPEVKPNEELLTQDAARAAKSLVKPLWQQTVSEAVGVAPQVPDPPGSLAKRYGKQGPTPEQVVADRAAKNLRAKGLKEQKAYVERSNLHLQNVQDAIAAGEDVPQEVLNNYPWLAVKTSKAVPSAPAQVAAQAEAAAPAVRTVRAGPDRITIDLRKGFPSDNSPATTFLNGIKATENLFGSGFMVESGSARAVLSKTRDAFLPRGFSSGQVINIDSLQLTARGNPDNTLKLLRQITKNADTTGVTLTLDAVPYETATAGKTTPERLKSLYARYGFTPSDAGDASLIRQPKLPAPAAPAASKLNYQDIPKGAETASGRIVEPVPAAKPISKAQKDAFAESENIRSAFDTDQVSGIDSLQEIPEGAIGKDGYGGFWRFKNGKAQRFKETTNQFSSAAKREHSDTVKWSKYSPDDAIQNVTPAVEPPIARVETPAAAQQVDTPVTPAAGGGGKEPPITPRDTATGGASGFKGTPQSSRSFPTWEDSATHNRISAELAPVIEERLGQAAKTTALKTSENNKIKDIANRQAEKVREAAISEGKTESQANALYREEWRKAYSGERTKSKLDLPLTISDLTDAQIRDSFTRVQREVPGDTYLINKIFEATRALDAITGKTQGAKKSELESLKFWVNLMSPEEESRYLENQFRNYGGFNSKNAKLLVTQEKLLKAKPAFGADDIADDVPVGRVGEAAGEVASDGVPFVITNKMRASLRALGVSDEEIRNMTPEQAWKRLSDAPSQTGEPTASTADELTGEPTAPPVDESINQPIDKRTGEPVITPPVADGAGVPGATGEGGGATGGGDKGGGKGGSKDGDGAEPGDPEEFDLGKTWAKNAQELNDERNVNDLTTGFGLWANFKALLSLPRSLKSMGDLSGGGRQAAPYVYSHPNQGLKAFKKQMQAWGSEEGYLASNAELANKPYAAVRDQVVASSLVEQPLMNGEKTLVAQFAMVVPGLRRSERAYATFLNVLRDSAFEMMFKKSGLTLEELASKENIPRVKAWGDLINAATGHGDIGTLLNTSVAGNPILWAPNFLYSRVKLPWLAFKNLGKLQSQPELATEGFQQLITFVGVNSALLYGINASGLASVEVDPRSSDFGQIRIGNSRIDPWAGYRPIANLIARLQSGQTKSTTTGDISDPTNLKIVQDFLRNKMEPLSGEILNQILGSNSIGEPTVADTNMAIRLVAPLFLESMVRAINVGGPSVTPSENFSDQIASFGRNVTSPGGLKAAALTLPGVLGIGTATYEPLIKKMDRATLDRMSPQERNKFQTGERRGLANLTPAEQQKAIPALAFRQMYETMPSATRELSNYGSFSGFKRDKIREYAEYYMDNGVSKANAVLRAEQQFQNSGYQKIYQAHVNYLKYQWSEAHPGELAEEIEETYTINPRDRTFRPNAMQKAMAEPYLQKR